MSGAASAWVEVPFPVQKPHDGERLDSYLAARLHRYSRSQVQRLIAAGRVFRPGRMVKPAARVASGETVLIRYPRHEELPCLHAELPVIYEDDLLLAINKPAPLLCHPTDRIQNNTVPRSSRANSLAGACTCCIAWTGRRAEPCFWPRTGTRPAGSPSISHSAA